MADVRWDGDERGKGVADARALAPGAGELADAMQEPDWVAESPVVRQRRVDPVDGSGGGLLFEIVTGFLPTDTAFVPRGHTVRLSVSLT